MANAGQSYTVSFSSMTATGVLKDIFHLISSSLQRFKISNISIGQSTANFSGAGEMELLSVSVMRGSTVAAAGGSTGLLVPMDGRTPASQILADLNSSTPGESTSEVYLHAGTMETGKPFVWEPFRDRYRDERPMIDLSQRLAVRLGPSSAVITLNGSMTIEEVGKVPGE